MLGKIFNRFGGFDRYRSRGDRFFLARDFSRALREYRRARSILPPADYRLATVEALIRECAMRSGVTPEAASSEPGGDSHEEVEPPFHPGIHDIFELAIAGMPPGRASSYRRLGPEFEAGYVALVGGEAERSVRYLSLAARSNPPCFTIRLELGRALSLAGHLLEARRELEQAALLSPGDPEGLNLLAAVHHQLGDFEKARHLLQTVVDGGEAAAETFFLLGRSLSAIGHREGALAHFREAVRRDPEFHQAYFEGGKILEGLGDFEGAFHALAAACLLLPDEVPYNLELARLVLEHGLDAEAGLGACDRLMLTDEANRWRYLAWIAELYIRQDWRREARDPLKKALTLVPSHLSGERRAIERRLAELEEAL